MTATKQGSLDVLVVQKDGSTSPHTLHSVKYVPNLWQNLFAMGSALKHGWDISNEGMSYVLSHPEGGRLKFDRHMTTESGGHLGGIRMIPQAHINGPHNDHASIATGKTIDINDLHAILNHTNEADCRKTAKYLNWKVTGTFRPCAACGLAKAKQKSVNKTSIKSTTPGERLFFDISSIQHRSFGKNKFWLLIVDDCTDFCWSIFLQRKRDLSKAMVGIIRDLQIKHNKKVKYLRCDNGGENLSLQKYCNDPTKSTNLDLRHLQFEFTARGTPQQNGRVERKFATLYGKVRATLNKAKLSTSLHHGLWLECANTVTKTKNLLSTNLKPIPSYKQLFGHLPKYTENLQPFGHVGIETLNKNIQGKIAVKFLSSLAIPTITRGTPTACLTQQQLASLQHAMSLGSMNYMVIMLP